MKDQFFGNKRDYFKYDLVLDLMCSLGISRFTNIVMLTGSGYNTKGGKTNYSCGNRRRTLYHFLQSVANGPKDERKVVRLREYFTESYPGIEYIPYMNDSDKDQCFSGSNRDSYFDGISGADLQKAVILVDPDTGLLPRSRNPRGNEGHKWVTRCEISKLKEKMGDVEYTRDVPIPMAREMEEWSAIQLPQGETAGIRHHPPQGYTCLHLPDQRPGGPHQAAGGPPDA